MSTALGYCAEPSPDALSAYAASLGIGITTPANEALSIAQSLQGTAGSIGLRTQSITLMRDALYRMCEASNNGHLREWEVASFLRRSQDLTAVILAVEQLTGAITANQVILAPAATNMVSARLLSNEELLEQADARVAQLQQHKKDANDKLSTLNALENRTATQELDLQQAIIDDDQAGLRLQDAEKVRDFIGSSRDALMTSVTQELQGSAQFITTINAPPLSLDATKEITKAVVTMVTTVLGKSDRADTCLSFFTSLGQGVEDVEQVDIYKLLCGPTTNDVGSNREGPSSDSTEIDNDTPEDKRAPLNEPIRGS